MVSRAARSCLARLGILVFVIGGIALINTTAEQFLLQIIIYPHQIEVGPNNMEGEHNNEEVEQNNLEVEQNNVEVEHNNVEVEQTDMEVEYTNISVMRQSMIRGSVGLVGYNYSAPKEPEISWSVPPLLHFIWVGGIISEKYTNNILGFVANNPHFQVNLWTNENSLTAASVKQIGQISVNFAAKDINRTLLHQVNAETIKEEENLGAKSDLLRYEIIYQYGGLYVDIDSISLTKFETDFSHSFVSHTLDPNYNIQNSVFGFPRKSKFLKFVLKNVETNARLSKLKDLPVPLRYGPPYFTMMFVLYNDSRVHMIDQEYLVLLSNRSIMFQTMDASWKEEEKDDLEEFLKNKIQEKEVEEQLEDYIEKYDEYFYSK